MFELIGIIFALVIVWVFFKMVLVRVFPKYGLKDAEARYKRNPDDVNERLLWEARSRINNLKK